MTDEKAEKLAVRLREEFGIKSKEELEERIKKIGGIDITPFVADEKK